MVHDVDVVVGWQIERHRDRIRLTTTEELPMRPSRQDFSLIIVASCAVALLGACQTAPPEDQLEPHLTGGTDIERGRYLTIVAGCNDCHTDGYLMNDGDVPEDQWLLGSPVGWRGPWGTTYPPNLRLTVLTEDQWVAQMHTRTALPPCRG